MRKDISFTSKGLRCQGWFYIPEGLAEGERRPAVIMTHGLSAVKEMILPNIAEAFVRDGFVVLAFDYRYFGESEGKPRSQLFPLDQVEDARNAITWVSDQPEVDPQRIALWGTSLGGAVAVYTATFDKRVKAVVAQVPSIITPDSRRSRNPEMWDRVGELLIQDRVARYKTGEVRYMKLVAPEGEPCALPGQEAYDEYMALAKNAPNWRNEITLESLEKMREFDPVSLIHLISPAALLLIPAEKDIGIPVESIRAVCERVTEPKAISVLPIRHFEVYAEPWLSKAASLATGWFQKYL